MDLRPIVSAVGLALLLSTLAAADDPDEPAPITPSTLPTTASAPNDFVPPGWVIEEQITGDLNGDGRPDAALKMVMAPGPGSANVPVERHRALLVLVRKANGQWQRAAVATKLLQCTACGGALYGSQEAPAKVAIRKGVLIVEQEHGSRNVLSQTFCFRHEPTLDRFLLIGVNLAERDRVTGAVVEESSNFLTGRRVVTKARFNERTQRNVAIASTRSRIAVQRTPIEDVNFEDYQVRIDAGQTRLRQGVRCGTRAAAARSPRSLPSPPVSLGALIARMEGLALCPRTSRFASRAATPRA